MAETSEQRQARLLAAQNKQKNTIPVLPNTEPVSSGLNLGNTLMLMQALQGAPAGPVTTTPPLAPADAYQGTGASLVNATATPGVNIVPTAPVSGGAGPLTVMPGTVPGTEFAGNMPVATLTPPPAQTIMGMPPEQFAALAGMLGSALAPNEFGPTGQLVPSRMSKLGELGGSWGLAQMLAKRSSAPRTTIPKTGGE